MIELHSFGGETASWRVWYRAYGQLKQQKEEEARRREEEEDLINLLRAEEAAERDRRATDAARARQEKLRAEMLAANKAMMRLKVGPLQNPLLLLLSWAVSAQETADLSALL